MLYFSKMYWNSFLENFYGVSFLFDEFFNGYESKLIYFFAFCLWQLFCNEKNVWKTRVFMMIVKEAKIWLKCFLQFLHDLICDFFALYLSQYRLNKLFLHNLLLWFSFYVQISYSNSSSPFFSLVLFYRFPSNFHFLQSLYLQYNCI